MYLIRNLLQPKGPNSVLRPHRCRQGVDRQRHQDLLQGIRPEQISVQELRLRRDPVEEGQGQAGGLQPIRNRHRLTGLATN